LWLGVSGYVIPLTSRSFILQGAIKVSEDTVRISVPVPRELNDMLNRYIPKGLKAQIVRALLELLITTQRNHPERYIVDNLLNERVEMRVQNLNRTVEHD
jgi:hypothetical protein